MQLSRILNFSTTFWIYAFCWIFTLRFEGSLAVTSDFNGTFSFQQFLTPLNATVKLACEGNRTDKASWWEPSGNSLEPIPEPRIRIDANGTLIIFNVDRKDGGYYWCTRDDDLSHASVWHLKIDPHFRHHLEMESITYGWYAGLGALIIGITVGLMKIIVRICCPQCHARASAAARIQQMRHLIVGLETYRLEQSNRLRENYNSQVTKVKDTCAVQMENLRDHYSTKITRFRNCKLPLGTFRDQYSQQVGRIRDYSSSQMERLGDNYARNLGKLRTYSVVQLERFRQQYQLQHKHMAKILEAMNFNLESCRTGTGDLTPSTSMVLNMEISLAQLHMDPSDINCGSADSITIDQPQTAFVVQAECVQRSEVDVSSLFDYETPPSGGTPVVMCDSPVINGEDMALITSQLQPLFDLEVADADIYRESAV